jgi:CopG family nickel-responsive transcriptional regulator
MFRDSISRASPTKPIREAGGQTEWVLKMEKAVRFGVSIPRELLERFDEKIDEKEYPNRSEAIRDIIRDFLAREKWESSKEQVYGSLTLVFDHDKRGISDKLTDLQHQERTHVLSTMHIHLDKHHCMEMVALRGLADEVKALSDRLIATKGVKQGKLMMTAL